MFVINLGDQVETSQLAGALLDETDYRLVTDHSGYLDVTVTGCVDLIRKAESDPMSDRLNVHHPESACQHGSDQRPSDDHDTDQDSDKNPVHDHATHFSLETLPVDALLAVCRYLDAHSKRALRLVSQHFRDLMDAASHWRNSVAELNMDPQYFTPDFWQSLAKRDLRHVILDGLLITPEEARRLAHTIPNAHSLYIRNIPDVCIKELKLMKLKVLVWAAIEGVGSTVPHKPVLSSLNSLTSLKVLHLAGLNRTACKTVDSLAQLPQLYELHLSAYSGSLSSKAMSRVLYQLPNLLQFSLSLQFHPMLELADVRLNDLFIDGDVNQLLTPIGADRLHGQTNPTCKACLLNSDIPHLHLTHLMLHNIDSHPIHHRVAVHLPCLTHLSLQSSPLMVPALSTPYMTFYELSSLRCLDLSDTLIMQTVLTNRVVPAKVNVCLDRCIIRGVYEVIEEEMERLPQYKDR